MTRKKKKKEKERMNIPDEASAQIRRYGGEEKLLTYPANSSPKSSP
jgi:hypothetical protein